MNKILLAVVVVIILVVAAVLLSGKNKGTSTTTEMQPTPTTSSVTASPAVSPTTGSATVSPSAAGTQQVSISNFAFSPATLHVKVGEKVTWTNKDSTGHSATADDGSFDTGILAQGSSASVTFNKAGTYSYHCSVHPNMKGTVIVE